MGNVTSQPLPVVLWARLADWVRVEGDLPQPLQGSVLPHVGIRAYGTVERVSDAVDVGLIAESQPSDTDPRTPVYAVTATVESSRDFEADTGSGSQHAGLELVLDARRCRLQAQVEGHAHDVEIGSRVTVRGTLFVIGQYEWEAFGLVDTRADWRIEETLTQPDGDYVLRLTRAPGH